jgi:Spy/CpxP family protein refolding chaperone
MKKTIVTMTALLFAAVVSTSAFAANWGRGPGFDRSKGYGPCYSESFRGTSQLNLTQEQLTKLAEIQNAHTKAMLPLREQMFAKRNVLKALWLDANPDKNKILAAHKEINALQDQIQEKSTEFRLESLKVLTPAQQEIAKAHFYNRGPGDKGAKGARQHAPRGGNRPFQFGPACPR